MATCKHEALIPLVKELYLQGYTRNKISKEIGVDSLIVRYILYDKLKVANKKRDLVNEMPKELVNRVITLASWGYTKKEIAEDLQVNFKLVADLITEATDKKLIQKFS